MKLSRKSLLVALVCGVIAIAAKAEVPTWLQWLPATSPANGVLYRSVPMLGGATTVRRPPRETVEALVALSSRNPTDTELVTLSAREYEAQLDFTNAEARWKLLDTVSPDRVASQLALADYYHRRLQPQLELQALIAAESRLPAIDNPLLFEFEQRAWKIHDRIQQLIQVEALPAALAIQDFETWIRKYPSSAQIRQRYFDFLVSNAMLNPASQQLDRYKRDFPQDRVFPIRATTVLAEKRGSPNAALAAYDAAFDPLWPQVLIDGYFKLLTDSHRLFEFHQNARQAARARPLELAPATRLFHYHRSQSDLSAARRELSEFRIRKEGSQSAWTISELSTLARLFESVKDHEEVIRYAYALYSLPSVDAAAAEASLVQIIGTLLEAPDQPLRFGRGDLSFYRDIATMDASPGFLNGILSLIFNSQHPESQFRSQERKSEAYFHRAKAAELYALLTQRFPRSESRSRLLSRLIETYATYGENDAIIQQGTAFINEFPNDAQRTRVALQIADAHARLKQVQPELDVYDRLLGELAAKAQQVPLGGGQPRSPEYAEVLQRYVSRLSQLNRIADALALYRREIDRNANDPGLYDRLADFLGANQRAGEIEEIYRRATQRFQDRSWWHKLARYYLRYRLTNQLRTLSQEIVDTFSGAELEAYVADVIADGALERRLQLEINLYAHRRFPHDLRFVHNLIGLYSTTPTADGAALTRLLSDHWHEDETIRRSYFERLNASGTLNQLVQEAGNLLPANSRGRWEEVQATNPAIARFLAEAAAWQSHFETAAPIMQAIAAAYPADQVLAGRATDVYRSLAAYDTAYTSIAASFAENLSRSEPRSRDRLIRLGEIFADREQMGAAGTAWSRVSAIEPGKPASYLEEATVWWDYLRPSEALATLREGRAQVKDPTLWTYEVGAILEAQGRRREAVAEYIDGALRGRNAESQARLLRLAARQEYRSIVDEETGRRVDQLPSDPGVLELRVSVLRAQQRQAEIETYLRTVVDRTTSREILSYIGRVADESALRALQTRVYRREIRLETDPQEQLRLRLELAGFIEAGGDLTAARTEIDAIYQSSPLISGVIRATADFYWRHDKPRTIRVLSSAAERAHDSLKRQYLTETVRRAIEARQFADAMRAADSLLRIDPINGQYVALMADTLAAEGKDVELQQLYTAKISEIQQASISQTEKTDRVAALRRGLIPVFVRQGKHREALDQFIEIINRFPDDENVLAEAAQLATQQGLRPQLVGYYSRTAENSPRDPRWAIVLARIQTQFEDYPAAIEAYSKAMAARPERQDLAMARANLEERSFRFAEAIATYNRVYELSLKNPVWLERIATLQARLGQNSQAITTVQRAFIDNQPEAAREYGRAALVLENLGIIDAAAGFIRQQIGATGSQTKWRESYARIMTRARRHAEALPVVIGFGDSSVSRAMGLTIARYFTPEERQGVVSLLTQSRQSAAPTTHSHFMDIASTARLHDVEVTWRLEEMGRPSNQDEPEYGRPSVTTLQERRMRFAELARQLESLATSGNARSDDQRREFLYQAVRAYQAIGDTTSELRLFDSHSELQANQRRRYYELLARMRPDQLLGVLSRTPGDFAVTQAFVDAGDQTRALQAVQSQRGTPVWTDSYTSLVGTYFGVNSPEVRTAFQRALGPPLMQDRIGRPVDRTRQLAGDIWFYYGQRYSEYLRDFRETSASDSYVSSQLELRPGDPEAYLELARFYRDAGESERALVEFRHALELDTRQPGVHSQAALVLWDLGRRSEALAEWREALTKFASTPTTSAGPQILRDIRSRQQTDVLRAEIDKGLRAAAGATQAWQLTELLQAAFENSDDHQWLMDIVRASQAPGQVLTNLVDQPWLRSQQLRVLLQAALGVVSSTSEAGRFEYQQLRTRYLEHLIDTKDARAARQLLDTLSPTERDHPVFQQAAIRVAAMDGRLDALLESYRQNPVEMPPDWTMQEAAAELSRSGMPDLSQRILEFLFSRQLEASPLNSNAYFGLAGIRLQQGRVDDAVQLLKRLNIRSVTPFDHLLGSARLLSENSQAGRAEEFLKMRIQAVPWDQEAHLELARVQLASNQRDVASQGLLRVATSPAADYDLRTQAAKEFARSGTTRQGTFGSRELDALAAGQLTSDVADAPQFFAARLAAAEQSTDAPTRLRLLLAALAERPNDAPARRLMFAAARQAQSHHVAIAAYLRAGPPDAEVAAGIAESYMQIGQPEDAVRYFRIAASQERDPALKLALDEQQKQAAAANQRLMENERRQPVIQAELDQPNAVRRRLQ